MDLNETASHLGQFYGPDGLKLQSNNSQRLCACESQYWDSLKGCTACYRKHGEDSEFLKPEFMSSISSAYCAATATPSLGLIDYLERQVVSKALEYSSNSSSGMTPSTSFSDPMGTKTAVSLYYTPGVTGPRALDIGSLTGGAKMTTTNIVNGQIVATGGTTSSQSPTGGTQVAGKPASTKENANATELSSSSSTGGVAPPRTTHAALAGVIGLVGLVAIL